MGCEVFLSGEKHAKNGGAWRPLCSKKLECVDLAVDGQGQAAAQIQQERPQDGQVLVQVLGVEVGWSGGCCVVAFFRVGPELQRGHQGWRWCSHSAQWVGSGRGTWSTSELTPQGASSHVVLMFWGGSQRPNGPWG